MRKIQHKNRIIPPDFLPVLPISVLIFNKKDGPLPNRLYE
jgi:hypothetical protein